MKEREIEREGEEINGNKNVAGKVSDERRNESSNTQASK